MMKAFARIASAVFATIVPLVLLTGGCQQPGASASSTSAGETQIDRRKAFLKLDEITPKPALPAAAVAAAHEPVESAQRYLTKGRERFREQLWTDAISSLEKALQADAGLVEARLLLARAAMRQGNNSLAESHLREVVRLAPREAGAYQMLGEIAWQENKTAEAISSLRLALAASEATPGRPERVLAHLTLAMALRKDGYLSAAVEQLEAFQSAAANPSPEMTDYRELAEVLVLYKGKAAGLIGEIESQLGRYDLAAKAYERAVQQSPDDVPLRIRWSQALARAGRADAALAQARKVLADSPENAGGLALLKEVCELLKQPQQFDVQLLELARTTKNAALRMQLADMLLSRDRTDAAMEVLTELVKADPADVRANCLLAKLNLKKGEARRAVELLDRLLSEHPTAYREVDAIIAGLENAGLRKQLFDEAARLAGEQGGQACTQYLYGAMLRASGRPEDAIAAFSKAAKLDKRFGAAAAALARGYAEQRSWTDVIRTADQAIKNGAADSATYLYKGKAHLCLDDMENGESALLEAFRLDPKSPEPLFVLAVESERRGEKKRCEQLYKRILDDVDPRHLPSRERLVRLYLNTDKLDKAKDYFSDFERFNQTGAAVERCRAMLTLATSQNASGQARLDEYRADLRRILEKYPDDPATRIDLAMSFVLMSDYAGALAEVDGAIKADPNDARAKELRGTLLIKLLDYDAAAKVFKDLLSERPRDLNLQRNQLDLAINRADWKEAVGILESLIGREDLRGGRDAFMRQIIDYKILSEEYDEAVKRARDWLADAPADSQRRQAYLTALRSAKRFDESVSIAAKWLADDPTNSEVRLSYIEQLMQADRLLEAEQKVLSWLSNDPDDINLQGLLISLAWRGKQWDRAIELAKTGSELTEHRVQYQTALGRSYRLARRFDDALELYRSRVKAAPTEAAYDDLIATMLAAERWDEAEQTIQALLTPVIDRKNAGAQIDPLLLVKLRRHLANLFQLAGRDKASVEQLEEIYKLAPLDPGINNDLGYTWADEGVNLDEAEKMVRMAVRERPRESAYLDSLGWVLYKRGKFAEALVFLERAVHMGEATDPVLFDHLADALYRSDRKDEAAKRWKKALELIDSRKDDLDALQYKKLRPKIEGKLRQLSEGTRVDVAEVGGRETTTRPSKAEAPK